MSLYFVQVFPPNCINDSFLVNRVEVNYDIMFFCLF